MSVLASNSFEGAEDFFHVIAPKPKDLGQPFIGACYRQKADICWIPERAFSEWVVTRINGDLITLQPLKPRWINSIRQVNQTILQTEYRLCSRQRQNNC